MNATTLEQRTSPRKAARGPAEISDAVSGGRWPVDMLDVSIGGVSFLTTKPFVKDTIWLVRFELNERVVRGVISIVYCVKHSLADAYRVGASFRSLEEHYQDVVRHYVDAQ